MTIEELRAELEAGKTIAEVAGRAGRRRADGDRRDGGRRRAHIDETVADGDLDEEEAAELKADLEARITEAVNNGFRGGPGPRRSRPSRSWPRPRLEAAAEALGMTTDELRTELEAGKTIADVAGEQGVDVQTVIDAMVADVGGPHRREGRLG